MLQKIKLQNFKLHKDTTLEIKPITLFIGQNNSGKSSIFQALQLIKQNLKTSHEQSDRYAYGERGSLLIPTKPEKSNIEYYLYPNRLIDIGTFQDVIRKNERFIGISIEGNLPVDKRALKEKGVEIIQIRYEMKFRNNTLNYHCGEIKEVNIILNGIGAKDKRKIKIQSL